MSAVATVFGKEVRDNFRDRRTLLSALVLGPVFGPLMFIALITLSLSRGVPDIDVALPVTVAGTGSAPSLIAFLEQENVEVTPWTQSRDEAIDAVARGDVDLVLVIPDDFSQQLRDGSPARVEVVADLSNSAAGPNASRLTRLIEAWGEQLGAMRLQARGVDPRIAKAIRVQSVDTSTPSGRAALILGMLTYFLMFSMLMGGMYLAIDTTAGERERGSLEPLLTVPVAREKLIVGKILAACFYMVLSLAASLTAFVVALNYLPLEKLGMSANFGPAVAFKAFLILAPFSLLGASLMTIVASFTKSYKEAQSYMTVLILLPTIPIIIAAVLTLRGSLALMTVPGLSQHLLVTELIKNEPLAGLEVTVAEVTTVAIGLVLMFVATRLYRREGLLI